MSSLLLPTVEEVAVMSAAEIEACLRGLDRERRVHEARIATFVAQVEATGGHLADGHRTVRGWGKAACNWSGSEAFRFQRLGRMLARFPSAASAAAAGTFGVAQMHALAAVTANPRVQPHLADAEELLVGQAVVLDFNDYITLLTGWEAVADADGAFEDYERADRNRRASLSLVGEQCFLDARGGIAHGVQLKAVLDAFASSEFIADWEAGVAEHGTRMCPGLLARSDAQRRFDAIVAIFASAAGAGGRPAGTPGSGTGAGVTVNLVVGYDLFQHHLLGALGRDPAPLDPNDPANRCTTTGGVAIDPHDMLVAAAIGHVRRVVLDAAGIVVDMGHRRRLFTGPLRDAVLIGATSCIWPGCSRPASACQADHLLPHSHAGPTATHNGGPVCGHHNRWKTRGYRTWRDPDGRWHHYRPDGTEIGWRADE